MLTRREDNWNLDWDDVFSLVTLTTSDGRTIRIKERPPRFISPYQVLRHIGLVIYEIVMSPHLFKLHLIFHVS